MYIYYLFSGPRTIVEKQIETITVADIVTQTIVVTQTPGTLPPVQVLDSVSEASQTAWMVVAILFLVIAIVAVAIIVILGFMLYQKSNAQKLSGVVTISSSTENILSKKEGTGCMFSS